MTVEEELAQACAKVAEVMAAHVEPFVAPISMSQQQGHGVAWGTGGYVDGLHPDCEPRLRSALRRAAGASAGPRPRLRGLLRGTGARAVAGRCCRILVPPPLALGSACRTSAAAQFDACCSAIERELLFWIGFPGYLLERTIHCVEHKARMTHFGELEMRGLPMLSQAIEGRDVAHQAFNPQKHEALHYPASATSTPQGPEVSLPNPKGMSGSLVWDTKFVRARREGWSWAPSLAWVCALVWAALDESAVVLATKVEHVRAGLPGALGWTPGRRS